MIAMVEGAKRQKTPNEIALDILLAALTIIFLLATVTLLPFSLFSVEAAKQGTPITITVLVALLVCLIPTTIGGLLSAIGIAGMDRMIQANVIATSGRAVEAAGDVDVLLLDKTGTITLGNRQASAFLPAQGISNETLADAAQLSSLADETPEGRSIVVLAKERYGIRERDVHALRATFVPFTAQTRMSGVDLTEGSAVREIRKGAADAVEAYVRAKGGSLACRGARRRGRGGQERRNAARRRRGSQGARRRAAQGHRQGRDQGALRRAPSDGDQDDHDHRRQPDDRGGHRGGGRRRRLPRPGHARGEAQAHSRAPERRAPRRDDRRRDERRPRARAGRRGGGHEHGDSGREGGRQHGRSRLEPDQVDRGRRDRKAAPDDARRADDVQHRERHREVLRHHPRRVRDDLSGARRAQRDAPGDPAQRAS